MHSTRARQKIERLRSKNNEAENLMALLDVKNLSIHFHTRDGIVSAVEDVSFAVDKGQVLGIVGESGSGKSVTCYGLMGLLASPPAKISKGCAHFQGKNLLALAPAELRKIRGQKISMIFQDPMTALNPYMSIGKQIIESIQLHSKIAKNEAKEIAIASLIETGIHDARERINAYPHEFSGGMRQRVMIAMALATKPELLIADEPTTALDVTVQAQILALLKNLQKKFGLAIIFISHDLAVIKAIADHVLVMEKGKVVEQGSATTLLSHARHPYTQALIAAIPSSKKLAADASDNHLPALLRVEQLNKYFSQKSGTFFKRKHSVKKVLNNINLTIKKGEIFGLVGESGCGKSTLGRCIIKILDADSGNIVFDGIQINKLKPDELFRTRRRFQIVFQDPYASLNPRMSVYDTLAEPLLTHKLASKQDLTVKVNQLMDDVGLSRQSLRKYPHEFSGGQRQRIAIARALALQPELIVADEPVSALDVTIQAQILNLLLSITRERKLSMLFISHDLAVVRYLCDRTAVMQYGELVETAATEDLFNKPQHDYTKKLLNAIPVC